jgi:hypothetical protein
MKIFTEIKFIDLFESYNNYIILGVIRIKGSRSIHRQSIHRQSIHRQSIHRQSIQ